MGKKEWNRKKNRKYAITNTVKLFYQKKKKSKI